ncbi:putative protein N(5)-glutamine methyltransferase [Saccharomonospora sp. NPDC006951]
MPSPALPLSGVVERLRAAGCVFAEDEARLLIGAATSAENLIALVDRRVAGTPLEHVLGWAEFHGSRIAVEPGVFVPRGRSEFLVDVAATVTPPSAVVVDLCCGSGALGAALARMLGDVRLYATDIDPVATECARRNIAEFGGHACHGDLYTALPGSLRGTVDVILANVPYVPSGEIGLLPQEARLHEPLRALDGGRDGLDLLRRVAEEAPEWLRPGGRLFFETSEDQAPHAVAALADAGLTATVARSGDLGATVVSGTLTSTRNSRA